jgi:hypothetical protein
VVVLDVVVRQLRDLVVLDAAEVPVEIVGASDSDDERPIALCLDAHGVEPASPNAHWGASEMSTALIAIAYPLVVNVSVGEVKYPSPSRSTLAQSASAPRMASASSVTAVVGKPQSVPRLQMVDES